MDSSSLVVESGLAATLKVIVCGDYRVYAALENLGMFGVFEANPSQQ
jgi:hypothetical protein